MISTTVRLTIYGDSHPDMMDKADAAIADYIKSWFDDNADEQPARISYELIVSTNEANPESDKAIYPYKGEVLARFKDEW